jgi:hypothetical protein
MNKGTGKKKLSHSKGDKIGKHGITYFRDIDFIPGEYRKAFFLCHCGGIFAARLSSVKCSNIRSCGCASPRSKVSSPVSDRVNKRLQEILLKPFLEL